MKKSLTRLLSFLLTIIMVMGMMPISSFAAEWDGQPSANAPTGSGTIDEPYQIYDAAELKWFANKVNGSSAKSISTLCAVLKADIDLANNEWKPIGYYDSYSDCVFYGGVFDGAGHTVSGLSINTSKQYQAFIGYTKGATVKNLTVSGEVKSTATSSSYAAGIVAYGNPVTIENCTNNADITSSAKGYLAGVVAGTTGGSKITNCNNNGKISGCGDFVGGITGSATGSSSASTAIQNCFNTGDVTNNGKPSSYSYSTGGIAGGISGASTISMCGNTGDITSTLKRTGGIAGSLGGSIDKCFNEGNIVGTYGIGGIAGDSSDKASSVTSCYNVGNVTGKSPVASFSDTNAKGVGGIIGGVASNSYKATLKDCYNTGRVISDTNLADVLFGGVIGDSSGKNYSGIETTDLAVADNCYYLSSSARQGDGRNSSVTGIAEKTSAEMKSKDFADTAGKDYIENIKGGYPLLSWQNPDAEYDVNFILSPAGAALTVKDEKGNVAKSDGLTYHLKNGTYSYTVTGEECEDVNGSFTVAYSEQTITVSLKVKTYDFVFVTNPADAALTVEGQTPLADARTYQLAKVGNPYTYKVSAFGYVQETGTVNVTGNSDNDKLNVNLKKQQHYTVTLPFAKENGGTDSEVFVQVKSNEYPSADIVEQSDGTFFLPDGSYTYTISSSGYKAAKGSFTVNGENITLPQTILEIQTAWDGETITEPAQDSDGIYLITNPDELIWYQQKAALNSSARLMADIRINEEVSAENAENQYNWAPIGTNSSKAYTGDFDGNNHTISGLYISANANNIGVFGFAGNGASIHNLTVSDSIIIAENSNYVGAVTGDLKGNITDCHVTESVTISGKSYVGGIVGELDNGGTVNRCSNAGNVNANSDAVGGVAGRIYSAASNALTDSLNTGNVTGVRYAGGIAGMLYNNGTVENVYSTGNVTATNSYGGGLIGYFRCGAIRSAYTTSNINAVPSGGAFGFLDWPSGQKTADKVYYLKSISDDAVGNTNACTLQGTIKSCTSDGLKIMADALGNAFYENETEQNNSYPLLYWQVDKKTDNPDAPAPDPDGWNGKTSSTAPSQTDGIYQIGTPSELKWFARASQTTPDIQGILTADIDLNYQPWSAIGGSNSDTAFAGIFDGNGFSIKNLYISSNSSAGLFAYNAGEIKNFTIDGIINSADNTASVAVYNSGKITKANSYVNINGGNHIAGIVSYNEFYGSIAECRNFGNITGGQFVSGITSSNKGEVTYSGNSGAVIGTNSFVSGVVADNSNGTVKNCSNNGNIISKAAIQYAYTGGVVGRNNSTAQNLYNSGNVISLGSSVGGCVAINTSGAFSDGLYNAGDVCGSYIDTENGKDFRVGGAIGEIVSGVSNAYTLNSLTISTGGTLVSQSELDTLAGTLTTIMPIKSSITGTAVIDTPQAESAVKVRYDGNATQPIFVWYIFNGYDETTLSISDEYTVPANLVGYRLYAKIMDSSLSGIVKCTSEPIDGFNGSVKINGYVVVGHTLSAVYTGSEIKPSYQWYRGSAKIENATSPLYIITDDDEGKVLSVRVTGSKPGYIEKKTDKVRTPEDAGIWDESQVAVPKSDSNGTYLISNEAELKWFASFVNSGHTTANAKLTNDIKLTCNNWYPIGSSQYPYTGTFDADNKKISGLKINSAKDEQGFFGNVGSNGEVKNLSLSGTVNVTGDGTISTGGIAGYLEGRITDCSFSGTVNGVQNVGGIVGQSGLNSNISRCINNAIITGKENVGGIAGSCSYGNIIECVNTADIGNEKAAHTGGIAGSIANYAVVTACYNTGHIIGYDYMGGIAGSASVCTAPQGCYNIGKVDSGIHAFGVLGDLSETDYISVTKGSYYLTDSAQTATDKTAQGVNSDSMKKSAFVSLLNAQSGNNAFVIDLKNDNNGYPILSWQTGANLNDGEDTDPEQPDILTVTFSLCIDASDSENDYIDWIKSTECQMPKGSTAYDLFKKMLSDYGYTYEANGKGYVSSITNPNGITLEEFDKGPRSGWMYTINKSFPDYLLSAKLKNKDEMCFFYTNDYKKTGWTPTDPVVIYVESLIDAIGTVTSDSGDAIQTARDAYDMLSSEQKFGVSNKDILEEAEKRYAELLGQKPTDENKPENSKINDIYIATGNTLLGGNIPDVSSTGGEWVVLGLARSERISKKFKTGYYNNLVKTLNEKGTEKLHRNKSTENSRAIIALSSLGYDATDVEGYNLLLPLADMDYLQKQGVNGLIWALIAFDTVDYEIPTVKDVKNQTTREKLIKAILDEQTQAGSWLLGDEIGDIDLTAMAIQALAPYVDSDPAVKSAVDNALNFISNRQRSDGGFVSNGKASCECCAQVIVALTSLGIDPDKDERFVKNGNSVLDALVAFYNNDGTFRHTKDSTVDEMATEQAYYALVSYYRYLNNQTSLYDMGDVKKSANPTVDKTTETTKDNSSNKKPSASDKAATTKPSADDKNNNLKSPMTGNNSAFFISPMLILIGIALIAVSKQKRKNSL